MGVRLVQWADEQKFEQKSSVRICEVKNLLDKRLPTIILSYVPLLAARVFELNPVKRKLKVCFFLKKESFFISRLLLDWKKVGLLTSQIATLLYQVGFAKVKI